MAAAAGIRFCFIKATEGDSEVDPRFLANWRAAKDAGIARGAYHFFHPAIPVTAQVDLFLRTVQPHDPGDLPPALDLEAPLQWAPVPRADRVGRAVEWLRLVNQGVQRQPMVYVSPSFTAEVLENATALSAYSLWIAQYTSAPAPRVPAPWNKWTFWQHTGQGTAAGISTPVDLSWFNGTMEDLKRLA
jgi:lysozyme